MPVSSPLLLFLYAQGCLATLMLSLGDPLPFPYAALTAALAALAWRFVDRGGWRLPAAARDGLAAAYALTFAIEAAASLGGPVLALGHLVALLQATMFLGPKDPGPCRQLLCLGAVQAAVSCILSREPGFALAFLAYLPAAGGALWQLERRRLGGMPARRGSWAWTLLFGIGAATGALAIFWTLPRAGDPVTNLDADSQGVRQLVTGYSPDMDLQDRGVVAETADIAFTVRATDSNGRSARLPPDMLWRGTPVVEYVGGKWKSIRIGQAQLRAPGESPVAQPGQYRLRIESPRERGLHAFGPLGVTWGRSDRPEENLDIDRMESCLRLRSLLPGGERATGPIKYSLTISLDNRMRPPEYDTPSPNYLRLATVVPPALGRLRDFARSIVADGPADAEGQARKLLGALQGPAFGYSLTLPELQPNSDPVESFLFDSKIGNCELYASALCLMLRSAGIPARIVQGYKGVDYNEAGDYHQVRALHAHAWVEAYLGGSADRWLALDPTPGQDRERLVEGQRSRWQWFDDLLGAARNSWYESIIGYQDGDFKQRLTAWFRRIAAEVWAILRHGGPRALGLAAATLAAAGAGVWLLRRWRRRRKAGAAVVRRSNPRWSVYAAWLKLARARGCPKLPWQTPQEHAAAAAAMWRARPELAPHADLPEALVAAHYGQRYGDRPADAEHWRQRLAAARKAG